MAKGKTSNTQPFWRFLLVVYSVIMLWLLFGRPEEWSVGGDYWARVRQNINLDPFLTIDNYVYAMLHSNNGALVRHCFINLGGNILLFIPAGYLITRLWRKQRNFFLFLITAAGLILTVEALQLFTLLGRFDIDDMILNISGMFLGYLACILTRPR